MSPRAIMFVANLLFLRTHTDTARNRKQVRVNQPIRAQDALRVSAESARRRRREAATCSETPDDARTSDQKTYQSVCPKLWRHDSFYISGASFFVHCANCKSQRHKIHRWCQNLCLKNSKSKESIIKHLQFYNKKNFLFTKSPTLWMTIFQEQKLLQKNNYFFSLY